MEVGYFITQTDLDKLIARIEKKIEQGFANAKANSPDKPLSAKQAAKYLGISRSTFDERFRSGEYPSTLRHGAGKVKTYFASELENFIRRS